MNLLAEWIKIDLLGNVAALSMRGFFLFWICPDSWIEITLNLANMWNRGPKDAVFFVETWISSGLFHSGERTVWDHRIKPQHWD